MLDDTIANLISTGLELHYLRGAGSRWEALVRRRLPEPISNGARYAVGFAPASEPALALDMALEALSTSPKEITTSLQPTCASSSQPAFDLMALLGPGPTAATLKPFKLGGRELQK